MSTSVPVELNKIFITVVEARNLIAADSNGKSDPYVVIQQKQGLKISGQGKTKRIDKTLNPVWNEKFEGTFNFQLSKLVFKVYDWDRFTSDDFLGKAICPIETFFDGEKDLWLPLGPAKGELHVKVSVQLSYPTMIPGAFLPLPYRQFSVALGWDVTKKKTIDLDVSVVALDSNKKEVDRVSYSKLTALNGTLQHKGDNRTGEGEGDDEEIKVDLHKLLEAEGVATLAVIINSFTMVPFSAVKSAYIRLKDPNGRTLVLSRLSNLAPDATGLLIGYLQFWNGEWYFRTLSAGASGRVYSDTLPLVCDHIILPPQ